MRYKALFLTILVLPIFFGVKDGWCRTADMRQLCDNCHTMHNSLGGIEVTPGGIGTQEALLGNTCYGCHRGANNASGFMPYVMPAVVGEPNYGATGTGGGVNTTLAGGSFYWVSQGQDNRGHNVDGLALQVSRIPPGGSKTFGAGASALTCAGVNGCHGNNAISSQIGAMYRTHHADDKLATDGSSVSRSYRFLRWVSGTGGIAGIEDPDYEFTVAFDDHNQYKGTSRVLDNDPDTSSISHLCASCHGNFHSGAGDLGVGDADFASPWIRHPVDYDMNNSSGTEYRDYGGAGVNLYMVETPLGSDLVLGTLSNVLQAPGDAIITCISCHRAHGSPYANSLRWDYQLWPNDPGYNGCGDCHTAKN